MDGLRDTLRRGVRLVTFLTVPATAGLWAVGEPVVRLLYERGRFHESDTAGTATALAWYSIGLVAYTAVKVVAPAFYALQKPRVPLLASASAVATNLLVILTLHGTLGFRAIALGTALGSIANLAVLLLAFQRSVGGLGAHGLVGGLVRMVAAAGAMAPAAWWTARLLDGRLGHQGLVPQLVVGLVPVGAGVAVYALASLVLGIDEITTIVRRFRGR